MLFERFSLFQSHIFQLVYDLRGYTVSTRRDILLLLKLRGSETARDGIHDLKFKYE